MKFLVVLALTLTSAFVFAQDPSPVVTQAAVAVATPIPTLAPAKVVSSLQGISDKIPVSLPTWLIVLLGAAVELIMRIWPTVQPRSLFILVGSVFGLIGGIFNKISSLLDMIVQNIKQPGA